MPRRVRPPAAIPANMHGSARFLWAQLVEQQLTVSAFGDLIAKHPKQFGQWLRSGAGPARPSWDNIQVISQALKLPFDEVRIGLGYTRPAEAAGSVAAPDAWELDSRRMTRRLELVLRRAPVGARPVIASVVDASLDLLSREIDRILLEADAGRQGAPGGRSAPT